MLGDTLPDDFFKLGAQRASQKTYGHGGWHEQQQVMVGRFIVGVNTIFMCMKPEDMPAGAYANGGGA